MRWAFSNDLPIYTQLIEQIKVGIVTGVFPRGERLPSVRDLATEAGVNPNTMQRAMAQLEQDGLAVGGRTAGRTVTEDIAVIQEARHKRAKEAVNQCLTILEELGYSRESAIALIKEELHHE